MADLIKFPDHGVPEKDAQKDPLKTPEGASDNDRIIFGVVRSLVQIAARLNNSGYPVLVGAHPVQTYSARDNGVHLRTQVRFGIGNDDFESRVILTIETYDNFWKPTGIPGPCLSAISPMRFSTGDTRQFHIANPESSITWVDNRKSTFDDYIEDVVRVVSGLPDPGKVSRFAGFELTPQFEAPSRPARDAEILPFHTPEGPGTTSS